MRAFKISNNHAALASLVVLPTLVALGHWYLWSMDALYSLPINGLLLIICAKKHNEIALQLGNLEVYFVDNPGPKDGLISSWLFLLLLFMSIVAFGFRCVWLLVLALLEKGVFG